MTIFVAKLECLGENWPQIRIEDEKKSSGKYE